MTRTAHVSYLREMFWAYDPISSTFLVHLVDEAETLVACGGHEWLKPSVEMWRVCAIVTEYGFHLDDQWSDAEVDVVVELLERTIGRIEAGGDVRARDVEAREILDGDHVFLRGHRVIPVAVLTRLGRAVVDLLRGRLPPAAPGSVWFHTFEDELETIAVRPDPGDTG